VSVSVGCDNKCTFCIVPLVRGPQLSRSLGDILAEVQGLARQGVVEVTLLGQNVNTYGRDLTVRDSPNRPRFAELLRAVDQIEGIQRIRFMSPHPHDFTADVVEAMAECESVCEHIHFPLQSGSDGILRRMRRSYRSERYLAWLDRIRAGVPGIAVTTDVIVGFPGETESDFSGTLEVVRQARFDAAFTFQYSPRAGTPASTFDQQVPKEVVQERFDRLVVLQERISLEKNLDLVGRRLDVLGEGEGRKGNAKGRTRTNKLVHFSSHLEPGAFAETEITEAHPHHLTGRLVS
jgi:tRNA-2-methylthio-N6-dimethylallyladenosine synthase